MMNCQCLLAAKVELEMLLSIRMVCCRCCVYVYVSTYTVRSATTAGCTTSIVTIEKTSYTYLLFPSSPVRRNKQCGDDMEAKDFAEYDLLRLHW